MAKEGLIKLVDEEDGIVVLEEENGEQNKYEVVTMLDFEDESYLILMEEDEETGEGYALKVVEDQNGEQAYQPVVDEDELVKLQQELEE